MLELIAQVEPMTLPLWAVLAFSAAMYPLGFMLGAPCSDCCQGCPPCSRCTNIGDGCQALSSVTVAFERGESMTTTTINDDYLDCVAGVVPEVTLETGYSLGACLPNGTVDIKARLLFDMGSGVDACGCDILTIEAEVEIVFTKSGGGTWACVLYGLSAPIPYSCTPQEGSLTFPVGTPADFACNGGACNQEVEDFSQSMGDITVSYETAGCDCGACCEDGVCSDNVAESACLGEWQGVGTDCDPDPC